MSRSNKMTLEIDPRILGNQKKILEYLARIGEEQLSQRQEQLSQKKYIKLLVKESKSFQDSTHQHLEYLAQEVGNLQDTLEGVPACIESVNNKVRSIQRNIKGLQTNMEHMSDSDVPHKSLNVPPRSTKFPLSKGSKGRQRTVLPVRANLSHDENLSDSDMSGNHSDGSNHGDPNLQQNMPDKHLQHPRISTGREERKPVKQKQRADHNVTVNGREPGTSQVNIAGSPVQLQNLPPQNLPRPGTRHLPANRDESNKRMTSLNNVRRGLLPGQPIIKGQPQEKDFVVVMKKYQMEINPNTIAAVSQAVNRSDVRTLPTVGLHTVLLLDTSASMAGQPFNDLKTFVNTMITDIDTSAVTPGLEEHVAIVTCGEVPTIAQHFTNDYQQIRTVVDGLQIRGRSPLMTSLVLSLCYLELQGQSVEIEGHLVPPRVIIISDFEATSDVKFQGPDTDNSQERIKVQTKIFKLSDVFKSRRYPIFCVPIGQSNNNVSHQLAENSGGEVITVDNPAVAGNYYRHQTVVGSVLQQYNLSMEEEQDEDIGKLITQVLPQAGLSQDHKGDVERLLEKALMADTSGMDDLEMIENEDQTSGPPASGAGGGHNRQTQASSTHAPPPVVDDDLPELPEWTYERQLVQLSLEEKGRLPELGTRVKRGADWKWGNEDGNGSGTIVGHKDNGCVYMVWDNMKMGLYRYGLENAYDLDKDLTPRHVRPGEIEIGCWVIRGPDWTSGDEDGGVGTVGVVVRKLPDRYVQVRWPSRVVEQYKFGADNKWDLEITLEPPHSAGAPVPGQKPGGAGQNNGGAGQPAGGADNPEEPQPGQQDGETFVPEKYEIIWKWEDSNKQGRIFSEEAIKKMENGYQTLKGKVFVQSNGKNIKVYIDDKEGKMECEIDGKRRPIMREVLLEAEVLTLREVEKFM